MAELKIEDLDKRVSDLEAGYEQLLEVVKKGLSKTEDKTEETKEVKKLVTPDKVFTVAGKKYQFTAPNFHFGGKLYVTEEVCADEKTAQALVEKLVAEHTPKGESFSAGLLKMVD